MSKHRVEGATFLTHRIAWRQRLPFGYHKLRVRLPDSLHEGLVISTPRQTYSEPERLRAWGLFAPLYGLCSKEGWGAGDFGDLMDFVKWFSRLGGKVAATLPLLPAFLDQPCEPSPYSPVSRLFWNEFFLDIDRIPELVASPRTQRLLKSAALRKAVAHTRESPLVQYRELMAAKKRVLAELARDFFRNSSRRHAAFETYGEEHPELEPYACFRAATERRGAWRRWPQRMRHGSLRSGDYAEADRQYHLYVQWLAHEQMSSLSKHCDRHGVRLYLDMPLGVHADGYDVWREQDLFALNASGGAPPDPVFTKGQDWGFAPVHPQRSRERGHRYVIDYLRHHLRHAKLLRFDHVMGLHRLYWVPHGLPASHGAYVNAPADELYAILCLESHRHRAMIVGENLGTVPPEVNRALARHQVREMFVGQYEFQPAPRRALRRVPARSVASLNTHDMPTFRAWWDELDLEDRLALGLLKRSELPRERAVRRKMRLALLKLLRYPATLPHNPQSAAVVLKGCLAHLSASEAEIVLVNVEDLWLEALPQNVPGTSSERPNWRRKLRFTLQEIQRCPELLRTLRQIQDRRRALKRGSSR